MHKELGTDEYYGQISP